MDSAFLNAAKIGARIYLAKRNRVKQRLLPLSMISSRRLILLIQTFLDNLRKAKYSNPIARIGGIPQSYNLAAIALFNVLDTRKH